MARRILWLGGSGVVLLIGFAALHAVVPGGAEHSRHTSEDTQSAWTRGPVVTGDPASLFDGHSPLSDPWIIRDENGYRMWFTLVLNPFTAQQRIGISYAESNDGVTWRSDAQHVLAPQTDRWDSLAVETPCVVKGNDGQYRLYYTAPIGPEGNHHFQIGLAMSNDGLHWQRFGPGPLLQWSNDWEKPFQDDPQGAIVGGVLEPCVYFDREQSLYRMWYVGLGRRPGEFAKYRIGYATSTDGVQWQRDPEPVFEPSPIGQWDDAITSHVHVTRDPQGTWHLFYFGSSTQQFQECEELGGCALTPGAIGHATSQDGRQWNRRALPILSPRKQGWDSWSIGGPMVLHENGAFRLWYFGNRTHNTYEARIGTAAWRQ